MEFEEDLALSRALQVSRLGEVITGSGKDPLLGIRYQPQTVDSRHQILNTRYLRQPCLTPCRPHRLGLADFVVARHEIMSRATEGWSWGGFSCVRGFFHSCIASCHVLLFGSWSDANVHFYDGIVPGPCPTTLAAILCESRDLWLKA